MFTSEQVKQAFESAQAKASARARELESEARKVLETLGDRAQAELKVLIANAKAETREQIIKVGADIEKLGRKLQDLVKAAAASASEQPPGPNGGEQAASGVQPPVS